MNANLKSYRISHGIKQIEVAKWLKVSKQTMNKWEMGRALIPYAHWLDLSSCLNISLDGLEKILIQTILEGCIESGDNRNLLNAKRSRVYTDELIDEALNSFSAKSNQTIQANVAKANDEHERKIFDLERALLDRDRRIFELEKEVDELKRQIKKLRGE